MSRKTVIASVILVLAALLAACAPPATPAPSEPAAAPAAAGKPVVFGAYATAIEEPWDGVIHAALNKAKEDGSIDYTYTCLLYTSPSPRD